MLTIGPTSAASIDALADIYTRSLDGNPDEHWTKDASRALLTDWLRRQPELFFDARLDGRIVGGFVVGVRPWWDGNHLVDGELFVDPEFQNQGVARSLVRQVLLTAQDLYAPILWETYTFNEDAFPLTWYRRIGFSEINEWVMIRANVATVLAKLS